MARENLEQQAYELGEKMKDKVNQGQDYAKDLLNKGQGYAKDFINEGQDYAKNLLNDLEDQAKSRPLLTVGISFALGMIAAKLFSSNNK